MLADHGRSDESRAPGFRQWRIAAALLVLSWLALALTTIAVILHIGLATETGLLVLAMLLLISGAATIFALRRGQNGFRLLARAGAEYRHIFLCHPQPMLIHDPDTLDILAVNDAAAAHYGYGRDAFATMTMADLLPEETGVGLPPRSAAAAHGWTEASSGPQRHLRADGQVIMVEMAAHAISFRGRRAQLVSVLDVTKWVATEQALTESRQWFESIFNLQFQFIAVASPDGDVLMINDLPLRAGGMVHTDIVGRKLWETPWTAAMPDGRAQWLHYLARAARIDGALVLEERFLASRGLRDVDLAITAARGDGGRIDYFIIQANDITRRKAAERALRESEQHLLMAQERANLGSWEISLVGEAGWWSQQMYRLLNRSPGSMALDIDDFLSAIHPDDRAMVSDFFARVRGLIGASSIYCRRDPALGRPCSFELVAECMRDGGGRPVKLVGILMDVSERLSMERRLQQSQRLESIGQLTGGVAHDFNNLLTVILGNSEAMLADMADDDPLRELADMSCMAAERGAELTHQLLAFARRQPLDPQTVDVRLLLDRMDGLLRRTLAGDIGIDVMCGSECWCAYADPTRLESVILNLAINARDAMPEGGLLTIEVANAVLDHHYPDARLDSRRGQYLMISVSDTGIGMKPDVIDRAFEPFFTTKENGRNSGLGLSMVHGFVKQSGGHIELFSEPGFGTTVKLFLPRAPEENVTQQQPPEQVEPPIPHGCERILVVESDRLVRNHIVLQLGALGYAAMGAADGREALTLLEDAPGFELMLAAATLPGGISGRELAERVHEQWPEMAVLFMSGHAEDSQFLGSGRAEPGVALIHKPYRLRTLAEKIRDMLDAAAGD